MLRKGPGLEGERLRVRCLHWMITELTFLSFVCLIYEMKREKLFSVFFICVFGGHMTKINIYEKDFFR